MYPATGPVFLNVKATTDDTISAAMHLDGPTHHHWFCSLLFFFIFFSFFDFFCFFFIHIIFSFLLFFFLFLLFNVYFYFIFFTPQRGANSVKHRGIMICARNRQPCNA